MEREIKFRVWDINKKVFIPNDVYGIITTDFKAFGVMLKDWEDYKEGEYMYPEFQTLVLYTGRKDKNGKEIYKGDVVNPGKGEIFYCNESEMFKVRWHDKVFKNIRGGSPNYNNGERLFMNAHIVWEIIGNVFQNPELLNQ